MSQINQSVSEEIIRVTSHWLARVLFRADCSISLVRAPLSLRTLESRQIELHSCKACWQGALGPINWLVIKGEHDQIKFLTTNHRQAGDLLLALKRELIDDCLREARAFHTTWQMFLTSSEYVWKEDFLEWWSSHKPPPLVTPRICNSLKIANQISRQFLSLTAETSLNRDRELHNTKFHEQAIRSTTDVALEHARAFSNAWNRFLAQDRYLARCDFALWNDEHPQPCLTVSPRADELGITTAILNDFKALVLPLQVRWQQVQKHNEQFLVTEEGIVTELLSDFKLTSRHFEAVILNEDNNLIQAGAGTGKTTTVVARVAYLVRRQLCAPDHILVLAFNNKAVEEIVSRLKDVGLDQVTVATFHAYGFQIVRKSGLPIGLLPEAEHGRIKNLLQKILDRLVQKDIGFRRSYTEFMLYWRYVVELPHTFASLKEYEDHIRNGDLRSLSGDFMRSREEVLVANFLTAHGINFKYEKSYEPKLGKLPFHYKPDFYLTDYNVYLEHFALDKEGSGPVFMRGVEYAAIAQRKRQIHTDHGTTLLESHSWQLYLPDPFKYLSDTLTNAGIKLTKQDDAKLLSRLNELDGNGTSNLARFIAEFISLMKNAKLTIDDLAAAADAHTQSNRCKKFLDLLGPVFTEYSTYCAERNHIDYDDMIFLALKNLEKGTKLEQWDHILVDEFQDCSRGRVSLLRELRSRAPRVRLYCVGDDWQSIYRFAGSDVTCMRDFSHTFGETRHALLNETFRYGDPLLEVSQQFIKRYPSQSQKSIIPYKNVQSEPIEVLFESRDEDGVHHILRQLSQIPASTPPSVLILARYNHHLTNERIEDYQATFGHVLSISHLSIHRAKGKEADYVIIDKVLRGFAGFPSEREDDPLLELVKSQDDTHKYGEERRLFYVALTRARKKVFVVTQNGEESCFVQELLQVGPPNVVRSGRLLEAEAKCILCGEGMLVPRTRKSDASLFFACSSPLCAYTEQPCTKCGRGIMRREEAGRTKCNMCAAEGEGCPRCKKGLLMLKTNRQNGNKFWGCSLWDFEGIECKFTRNVGSTAN